jgi:hypothetical protein
VLVIMEAILIAILLVMQTTSLSLRWAIVLVMGFGAALAVVILYLTGAGAEPPDSVPEAPALVRSETVPSEAASAQTDSNTPTIP